MEGILWQPPMTKAERIYHHYRVGHKEGGSLVAPQPEPDAGEESRRHKAVPKLIAAINIIRTRHQLKALRSIAHSMKPSPS
jgi:hypothetical protein